MDALRRAKDAMSAQFQSELKEKLAAIRRRNNRLSLEQAFELLREQNPELVKAISAFEKSEASKPPEWPVSGPERGSANPGKWRNMASIGQAAGVPMLVQAIAEPECSPEVWDRFVSDFAAWENEGR